MRVRPRGMDRVANGIAIVVVAIWAISTIADIIPQLHYDPPVAIYPALMLVLGAIFGVRIVQFRDDGEDR